MGGGFIDAARAELIALDARTRQIREDTLEWLATAGPPRPKTGIRSIIRDGGATRRPAEAVEVHFLAPGYSIHDAVDTYWNAR